MHWGKKSFPLLMEVIYNFPASENKPVVTGDFEDAAQLVR